MASGKPPLVLLHGLAMSGGVWREVVPHLSDDYEVHIPTAPGHRGGPPMRHRRLTMTDIVDAAEAYLDQHELDRPHLAGNSMGGFVAIELARKGRARSVCAFSPAGLWTADEGFHERAFARIRRARTLGRLTRPVLPVILRSPAMRRLILRDLAYRPDHVPAARALEVIDDGNACTALDDLCVAEWTIATLDPLPCPITIVWGGKERMAPAAAHRKTMVIPQAEVTTLPDVGHVPMLDDPAVVARTIAIATRTRD